MVWPPQVRKHGEHAAVIVRGRLELELGEDVGDVGFHRLPGHRQPLSDGLVRSTLRHLGEDGALPLGKVVERHASASANKDGDDGRVDD